MNLYLLSQTANKDWDTYDSCVVAADSEEDAKTIHPRGCKAPWPLRGKWSSSDWADMADVKVKFIGTAKEGTERGVILTSFNAG